MAGVIIASFLSAACVSNPPQGAAGGGSGAADGVQLAAGVAQAMLAANGNGNVGAALNPNQRGNAAPLLAQPVNLPAKLSCQEISSRLVKVRSETGAINAGPAGNLLPKGGDKLATAASVAALAGNLTGNAELSGIASQANALAGGTQQAGVSGGQDALRAALESRAAAQKCKLPIEARYSPAVAKMNCAQIIQAWQTQPQSLPQATGGAMGLAGAAGARGGVQDKAAQIGGLASMAASLTGNQELAQVANMANGVGGNANPTAGAVAPQFAREELEAVANERRCKLPQQVAAVAPTAAVAMNCTQIKQELASLSGSAKANKVADQAQTVGMLASLAGSLTGNETLTAVGEQANAVAGGVGGAGDVVARRSALEAQAKAQRCEQSNGLSSPTKPAASTGSGLGVRGGWSKRRAEREAAANQ